VATLKDLLQEVREDQKATRETLTHILRVQERQQVSLDEHVRRTRVAEERLDALTADLAPLKTHAAVWGALAKALAAVGVLVSIAVGVQRFLG
jgi:hypothetical protein